MVIGGNGMKFQYFYCIYVLAVLYVVSTLWVLAGVEIYVDVTSFITVFFPSLLVGVGSVLYSKDKLFSSVSITALVSGVFGVIAGTIATFSNVFDSQATFAGVAVSLLPLLYALFIILLIVPTLLRKS
ncbi:hypothetical protein VITU102760_12295 [Vibrio tubiashii]|uniref:MotA/TolQ/ExbB proton channel domain-containing protein n=2 Tax=Vibrio tubiashii TaxID=29498 RepID=F9T002_9VIBR|nr:hypothetical protein IX91_19440 [Vibrio tubiashii ATCC 19109]EGU59080.1 hypothetical protein VITU9109_19040 [Vibrio tubiashii ATCC 19109]EIF04758.1 hypothetical protein VT1337_06491 [Vibrio tubiashii NCIMB 1337 = ATCC 19106]